MKLLRLISRVIVGIVFIFSGFVKAIDPFGSAYKFIDYFEAFHLSFLNSIALPLAIILSSAEFLIGICLLLNVRLKESSWALFIFMVFFTILTFILAIYNPVSDCGCFGDAIILTNWQTFYKNIILMIFVLIVFIEKNKYQILYKPFIEWVIITFFAFIIILFSVYCINHLPVLDFRPYNIGAHIPDKMELPEDAPSDEYEIKLFYQKDGKIQEFNLENLPDSTWEFVNREKKLIKKGYVPPIHDFTIDDLETGEDIADIILEDEDYTFILIAYNLNKYNLKSQNKINELAAFCEANGYNFICLTSSLKNLIEEFKEKNNILFSFYNTDEITLKTVIRANPGLLLLKNGTIIDKWHNRNIPKIEKFEKNILANILDETNNKLEIRNIYIYILVFIILILLFNKIQKKYPSFFRKK